MKKKSFIDKWLKNAIFIDRILIFVNIMLVIGFIIYFIIDSLIEGYIEGILVIIVFLFVLTVFYIPILYALGYTYKNAFKDKK